MAAGMSYVRNRRSPNLIVEESESLFKAFNTLVKLIINISIKFRKNTLIGARYANHSIQLTILDLTLT